MKTLLIIIDGLGDEPIPQFKNKTPLEAAETPNLDFLAKNGICGLVRPLLYHTAIPTSEDTHFALFGYSSEIYHIRRGILTAQAAGMKMSPGDIALRGNFATVDENFKMLDRRAGRITETQPLIKKLNGIIIDKVKFFIREAGEYRIAIIMRGKKLSSKISDGDPHYAKLGKRATKIIPLDKSFEATRTAKVLNKFLEKAYLILKNHPLNKKRKKLGLPPANFILTRGASSLKKIPSFQEKYNLRACCVAGKSLYQQIGKTLGMDIIKVNGANGLPTTNLKGKIQAVQKALKKPAPYPPPFQRKGRGGAGYDFVFLHIKATDTFAEDGNFIGKKEFIEKIDRNLAPLLKLKNTLIVVTGDHSTSSLKKRHCKNPSPLLIWGAEKDNVRRFSEMSCQKGKLGKISQINLMPKILELSQN